MKRAAVCIIAFEYKRELPDLASLITKMNQMAEALR